MNQHDEQDGEMKHQAMVLTQTIRDLNPAEDFKTVYGNDYATYHSKSGNHILRKFNEGRTRVLVVVGKLLEGYDNKRVSVVGIVRNVAPRSRVLFAQFVGRAVRKGRQDDPVTAVIVSHPEYHQRQNWDQFEQIPERGGRCGRR